MLAPLAAERSTLICVSRENKILLRDDNARDIHAFKTHFYVVANRFAFSFCTFNYYYSKLVIKYM